MKTMTEQQATEWVYDQDDSQPLDQDDLRAAFRALYGREPEDEEDQWSLCCAATQGCGTRPRRWVVCQRIILERDLPAREGVMLRGPGAEGA